MRRIIAVLSFFVLVGLSASACSQRSEGQGQDTMGPGEDTSGMDSKVPEVSGNDTSVPDSGQPDSSDLDAVKADVDASETAGPDVGDPDLEDSETTDAVITDADNADMDVVDPDTTTGCMDAPTCECFATACVDFGIPPADVCGVLASYAACYDKLVILYQGGACAEQCGGLGAGLSAAICGDPDCAELAALLADQGLLPTACPGCACQPSCDGKVCGDDGCGGSCGECPAGSECDTGACVAPGPKTCDEAHGLPGCCYSGDVFWFENGYLQGGLGSCGEEGCGWDPGGGYYACGFSGADPSGLLPIECFGVNPAPETCPTCSCEGKQCGDDGCGASCGTCAAGALCSPSGQCVPTGTLVCAVPTDCVEADACLCVMCVPDGTCSTNDDCICPDCAADGYCSDVGNCTDDGICNMYLEGCICTDCAAHPTCTGG